MPNDFDNAVLSHIKKIYPNTYYANTAIVYNVVYSLADIDTLGFKLTFPLISIYRPTGFSLKDSQPLAARRYGHGVGSTWKGQDIKARYITVDLPYQIDIYAKSQEQLNTMVAEIIKYLHFEPTIQVNQSSATTEYIETYDITYVSGPHEASEFTNDDRVYHYAVVFDIKNAKLISFTRELPLVTKVAQLEQGEQLEVDTDIVIKDQDGTKYREE